MHPKRGQALVEFSLVVVFLLLLMAGTVDVVRALTVYGLLTNAAQEGATYGALKPTDDAGITTRVRESVGSLIPPEQIQVSVTHYNTACPGERIQIDVQTQMALVFPFAELFDPDRHVSLKATAQQVILNSSDPSCP